MATKRQWEELRQSLVQAKENGGWPLIVVNDRADLVILAIEDGLEPWGLHSGQTDIPANEVARLPKLERLHFGASTHNPREWSQVDSTCDHAGVGIFRKTATKPEYDQAIGLEGLKEGCKVLRGQNISPIAIGGLTVSDAMQCFQAGAESLAMTQVLSPKDIDDNTCLSDCLWQAQKIKYSIRPAIQTNNGVVIVGGSGAGKTTLASSLALRMGMRAIDFDTFITNKTNKSIAEIFDDSEKRFRNLELEYLPECLEELSVLALGAGAWQVKAIRNLVRKSGWNILWLAENPSTAWERIKFDPSRPLAQNRSVFMQRWYSRMAEWSLLPSVLPLGRPQEELVKMLLP